MKLNDIELCCPYCKKELLQQEETLECASCHRVFPVIFGIPDLRIFSDPYIDFESDREKARHLASQFEELTFEEMVRFYYLTTSVVPSHHAKQYTRGLLAAGARAEATWKEWGAEMATPGSFLEIGCGTAPLLIVAARYRSEVIGVDIALRWLVVAKKRLQEAGVTVPLVCACAEALPFPDERFESVVFDSTLEVVQDQNVTLQETRRVLKRLGHLRIMTPNRYSLGPDPHMKLFAGGYLPDRVIASYARRQNAIPPKRNLLSAGSLRRFLKDAGFESIQISLPSIGEEQLSQLPGIVQKAVSFYNISRNKPVTGALFRRIGPLLQAAATKPAGIKP